MMRRPTGTPHLSPDTDLTILYLVAIVAPTPMNDLRPPPIPLTKQAYDAFVTERNTLLQERKELKVRLKVAREQGDLSENGAYKYAKIELGDTARRLRKLDDILKFAVVVRKNGKSTVVEFGSTVIINDGKKERTYLMVGEHESNPMEGKLALTSPIGAALNGKKQGDEVTVAIPSGTVTLTIISIE